MSFLKSLPEKNDPNPSVIFQTIFQTFEAQMMNWFALLQDS